MQGLMHIVKSLLHEELFWLSNNVLHQPKLLQISLFQTTTWDQRNKSR